MTNSISVIIGHSAWNDLQLIGTAFERAGISVLASVSGAVDLADQECSVATTRSAHRLPGSQGWASGAQLTRTQREPDFVHLFSRTGC